MKKLIVLISSLLLTGALHATPDSGDFPGIPCYSGNSGNHKRWWCHVPKGAPWNPQLLCVDTASIDGSGGNDHTLHMAWGDDFATQEEVTAQKCNTRWNEDCETDPNLPQCSTLLTHKARATLNIEMGGFEDGLYVCKVEITDHLCTDEDVADDADYLAIEGRPIGKKWQISEKPDLSSGDIDYNERIQVHLNSFRFGTVIEVKYCYDFNRVVSGYSNRSQYGHLIGGITAFLTDSDYKDIADLSAEFSYKCWESNASNRKILAQNDSGSDFHHPLPSDTRITYRMPARVKFLLGLDTTGGCEFTATFIEGKVGTIRPYKEGGSLYSGQIKTHVGLDMHLIEETD